MNSTPKLSTFLNRCSKAALDSISPPRCLICLEMDRMPICRECENLMLGLPIGTCERCSAGIAGECEHCRWMSSLDWLRSARDYEGIGGLAVRLLKFSRAMELAKPMARMLKEQELPAKCDAIIPVPIHWSRLAQRGFNQSVILAKAMLPFEGRLPMLRTDLLFRIRATPPQARARGKLRRDSLQNAFESRPCKGARILLLDDVATSGGTLEACASALKRAGASWVGGLTFARSISTPQPNHTA